MSEQIGLATIVKKLDELKEAVDKQTTSLAEMKQSQGALEKKVAKVEEDVSRNQQSIEDQAKLSDDAKAKQSQIECAVNDLKKRNEEMNLSNNDLRRRINRRYI